MKRLIKLVLPAIVCVFCASVFARQDPVCDWNLLTSQEHWVSEIEFTKRGEKSCSRYNGCYRDLRRFVGERGLSVLEYFPDQFVTLAFPHGIEKRDRPFLLRGSLRGKTFIANEVKPTLGGKFYYRALSEARGLTPIVLEVNRPIKGSREIVVRGWTQVKLGMKHRLPLEDIVAFLNHLDPDRPELVPRLDSHGHLEFDGRDERGRHLRVSLVERDDGKIELVTAFQVR